MYTLTEAVIYDRSLYGLSWSWQLWKCRLKKYMVTMVSVTILAMFCQSTLNPSSLKENNAIPFLSLDE